VNEARKKGVDRNIKKRENPQGRNEGSKKRGRTDHPIKKELQVKNGGKPPDLGDRQGKEKKKGGEAIAATKPEKPETAKDGEKHQEKGGKKG